MKVNVKQEKCIGCGSCISLTDGNIFDISELKTEDVKIEDCANLAKEMSIAVEQYRERIKR